MIQEAYCSFEVSKLLKEKGFDERCRNSYNLEGKFYVHTQWHYPITTIGYVTPTHQMAMAWLREVHNLFIEIRVGEIEGRTWYDFDIIPINGREIDWDHYTNLPFVELNSYEEAVEAALKYVLKNLI